MLGARSRVEKVNKGTDQDLTQSEPKSHPKSPGGKQIIENQALVEELTDLSILWAFV